MEIRGTNCAIYSSIKHTNGCQEQDIMATKIIVLFLNNV
jgi:hypothetical protein